MKKHRVICVGSGMAALYTALQLKPDTEILLFTTNSWQGGSSYLAKGGIAIPVNYNDIECHIADTLSAGLHHNNPVAVRDLITAATEIIPNLNKLGIHFDASVALEGGHSVPRIRHLADETGRLLMNQLHNHAEQSGHIRIMQDHQVLQLLVEKRSCNGVRVFDKITGSITDYFADAVVLATGGASGLYLHHTNPSGSCGEGYGMASIAGAKVMDMEFIQFHPTSLYQSGAGTHPLITEALRGAGAVIRDLEDHDLIEGIHPLGSLAPRDIVSRAIQQYMNQHHAPHVWLDFSAIPVSRLKAHFPALYESFRQDGLLRSKRIPIVPAAHYTCGGVVTDTWGRTSLQHLYAVGEVARTGLHGANRLASNSLMELLVVSGRIATELSNLNQPTKAAQVRRIRSDSHMRWPAREIGFRINSLMTEAFGILRDPQRMKSALALLNLWKSETLEMNKDQHINPDLSILTNRLEAAWLIASQANKRKHSLGCHFLISDEHTITNEKAELTEVH